MLVQPPIEKLLPRVENRYILAMLCAKRARQLVDGAQPLSVHVMDNEVTTSAWELSENALAVVKGLHEVAVPLRPEVEAQRREAEEQARIKREEALMEEERRGDGFGNLRTSLDSRAVAQHTDKGRVFTEQLIRLIGKNAEEADQESFDEDILAISEEE